MENEEARKLAAMTWEEFHAKWGTRVGTHPLAWLGERRWKKRLEGSRERFGMGACSEAVCSEIGVMEDEGVEVTLEALVGRPALAEALVTEACVWMYDRGVLASSGEGREVVSRTWEGVDTAAASEGEQPSEPDFRYDSAAVYAIARRMGSFTSKGLSDAVIDDRRARLRAGGRPSRPSYTAFGMMLAKWRREGHLLPAEGAGRVWEFAPDAPEELPAAPPKKAPGRPKGSRSKPRPNPALERERLKRELMEEILAAIKGKGTK
jgi:hypothetical protein